MIPFVFASTTSHKAEAILPTLEVFARLDLRDVDLNLHHIIECGARPEAIKSTAVEQDIRIHVVSGGWHELPVRVWDSDSGAELYRWTGKRIPGLLGGILGGSDHASQDGPTAFAFSPDGTLYREWGAQSPRRRVTAPRHLP